MKRLLTVLFAALLLLPSAAAAQGRPQTRDGFFASFGFGYGSLGCKDCVDRIGGGAFYLVLGGTLSQKLTLGGEVTAWGRNENDATLSFGSVGPVIRFYPSATGGFYLKGGVGVATLELDAGIFSGNTTGAGLVLGVGYDGRVGRNFSLTPFFDLVSATFDGGTVNSAQFGLGFSFH
jgi:hypothetical protein